MLARSRRATSSRSLLLVLSVGIAVLSSGCWLQALSFNIGTTGSGYGYDDATTATIEATSVTATCFDYTPFGESRVECTYLVEFPGNANFELVSTAELISDFGLFGVLIDPIILQVPFDAKVVSATYNAGQQTQNLVVTTGSSFKAGPQTVVQAEGGRQFIILELPDSAVSLVANGLEEGVEFDFTLTFETASAPPIPVKPMFTIRVDTEEDSYYLPMLPCTTDFGEVPEFLLNSGFGVDGLAQLAEVADSFAGLACEDQVYDLRLVEEPAEPGADEYRVYVPGLASAGE